MKTSRSRRHSFLGAAAILAAYLLQVGNGFVLVRSSSSPLLSTQPTLTFQQERDLPVRLHRCIGNRNRYEGCILCARRRSTQEDSRKKESSWTETGQDDTQQYPDKIGDETHDSTTNNNNKKSNMDPEDDTIRVRIWRVLADGQEVSLKELGSRVMGGGHSRDLRSHLKHVAKQAETLSNKSVAWKVRRGLLKDEDDNEDSNAQNRKLDKLRLQVRKGKKRHETFVQLR